MMIRQSNSRGGRARPWSIEPREALSAAADRAGVPIARLGRLIGRDPTYLRRFIREGVPKALRPDDHETLAAYLGLDPLDLGDREYWQRDAA